MHKTVGKLLALAIIGTVALSGCSAVNSSVSKNVNSSATAEANAQNGIKGDITKLLSAANELKKEVSSGDGTNIKGAGTKLEDTWSSIEDSVKPKHPDLYENVEKYLNPTVAGSKAAPPDKQAIATLDNQLIQVLNEFLQHADADGEKVHMTDKAATDEFNAEEQQVKDVFNGVGLTPSISKDGTKEFTLVAEPHIWNPVKGVVAKAWTFNGQVAGPTIRVTEGDRIKIKLVNKLSEPTTIHWHGLHLPNDMDGVPDVTQSAVQPGQSFTYEFIASHPGTFMYHSHYDDMKQVGSGLYGAFIIDPKDPNAEAKYNHDYTMILSGFHVKGTMEDEEDYFTIDGRSYPDTPPMVVKKGETVRIRLINIDPTEYHTMHLHGMDFQVIAKDGHSSNNPQEMNTLSIGPGETYDIAFKADAVGTWMFHCHVLDHTMNAENSLHMGGLVTTVKVVE
ncbi:multicopper oxidase family protein [Bacillus sp. EB600]|uniref:multicopper oxidase family protein n=1 Tax=Bacillus sp. EB600 TaxID=2806345 RepID=UPI002108796E|nr:multicopper oxidase domain-containing protein [Bacillus sp. EB600]MCQ6282198.1 multicopper oxidase domain-containing protein [Bacillus sp. EB600]